MSKARKPIKDLLDPEVEKPVLERLYVNFGVATDQLRRTPETLAQITSVFNRLTSRNLDSKMLLRYMINRRKAKDWPRLGTAARKLESVLNLLNDSQLDVLRKIYLDLDVPSDELLFDPKLMQTIAKRFEGLSGTRINGPILISAIVAKRKRGLWVKIREPFADIEAIAASGA